MHEDLIHALDEERQNETRYAYPYPESNIDESKEIPIKEPDNVKTPKASSIDKPVDDEDFENITEDKDNKKRNIIILIVLLAFLTMIGLIFYFNYRNNASVVIVPDVSNMKTENAEKKLKAKGFKYTIESKESDDVDEGYVIKTTPKAGSSKKKGSVITIIESSGPTTIALDDYTGENANDIKEKLEKLGLEVTIKKKSIENPSEYVGKENAVIDQDPKYNKDKEKKLKKDDEITLFIPDIYAEYPKMKEEGWTLAKAESFAKSYGLNLVVKDSNGKTISDYSQYLSKTITNQDRTGTISSGVTFTVTIDADTATYNLTINYYEEGTTKSIENSTKETHKNGESGTATCPGIKGYTKKSESVNYTINNQNTTVNCYYKKEEQNNTTDNE